MAPQASSAATILTPEVVDETAIAEVEASATTEASALIDRVGAVVIRSAEDASAAAELRAEILDRKKAIEDWFAPIVAAAHRAHKALTERRKQALAPYEEPATLLAKKLGDWQTAERKRAEAAEARRQREIAEQRRQAEAAEAERREAERKRLEAEQLERAAEAEAAGDNDLAERLLNQPTPEPEPLPPPADLPPPPPIVAPAKVEGVTFVKKYRPEVVDLYALVRAAAARPELVKLLQPDMVALRKMASALGDAMAVPGVRVVEDQQLRQARR